MTNQNSTNVKTIPMKAYSTRKEHGTEQDWWTVRMNPEDDFIYLGIESGCWAFIAGMNAASPTGSPTITLEFVG